MDKARFLLLSTAIIVFTLPFGCGGGGGGNGGSSPSPTPTPLPTATPTPVPTATPTPQPVIAIAVTPTSATVDISQPLPFAAQVSGTTDTSVIWSVQEAAGGSITAEGVYTAPAIAGTYHLLATSHADASKVAVVAVRVRAASGNVTVN